MSRHLAELLVDGGLISRHDAETALRETRRSGHQFTQVLTHSGRIKSQEVNAIQRLELLLAQNHGGLRLSELLLTSGEMNRREMKRVLDTKRRTGRKLGEILIREGYLTRKQRARKKPVGRRFATAAVGAAVMMGTMGMAHKPGQGKQTLAQVAPAKAPAAALPPGVDLRFASLGDVSEQLNRLRHHIHVHPHAPDVPMHVQLRWRKYRPLVELYAGQYALPPELIFAMIERESSFNPQARSHANAVGLMQLIPHQGGRAAYSFIQRRLVTPTREDLLDPQINIQLGTAYLRMIIDTYFTDVQDQKVRVAAALAAYNWGPSNVRDAMDRDGVPDSMKEMTRMLEKRAPEETQDYVNSITKRMEIYS